MKKKLILAVIEIFVTVSLFAEYLGNKPSIDFTVSPEIFLAFEEKYSATDIELQFGGGANGNLLINFKLANFIYGYGSTIEKNNVFGFYLKNSYSALALTKRQFFDISLGGGIHGAFPMIPIGMEAGLLYSPINNNLIFEDFVGYMGEKITAGLRTNIYFDNDIKALWEVLFAWNFRFDIRNKTYNKLFEEKAAQNQNDWIKNHGFQKKQKVGDIAYFRQMIKKINSEVDDNIFEIPLIVKGYKTRENTEVVEEIILTSHKFATDKSDSIKKEEIVLKISTEEEKRLALNEILQEYNVMQELKKHAAENDRLEKEKQAKIFKAAVASKNVNVIADYIKENYDQQYFDESAYNEIAKLLAKNNNVQLKELPAISNPYGLNRNCIYLANDISVYQWTGNGTFLAQNFHGDMIYIRSVYDLTAIEKYADDVFLRYAGTFEYNSVAAGVQVVPQFDLIYSIKGIHHGK